MAHADGVDGRRTPLSRSNFPLEKSSIFWKRKVDDLLQVSSCCDARGIVIVDVRVVRIVSK
jgi:hypothetical protein